MDVAHCYLNGNADAVEFCPHQPHQHVLAVSTYTLQEGENPIRAGSISLFNVDPEKGLLELLHRVETAGIFDIKWNPTGANVTPLLAQADADGCLKIHRMEFGSSGAETVGGFLREINDIKIGSSMCLCLDWNPSATSLAIGLSDGSISVISLLESELVAQQVWKAHDYELWAATFDTHQPQLLYTGSDDCKFSCWDLREDFSKPAFRDGKVHKMGVCCISQNPRNPHFLLTGSYDEYLRVWDVRSTSKPISQTSISLGGGVWRIKYHPSAPNLVLAACMHNGFAIVHVSGDKAEVTETYRKHDSLAYGADWRRGGGKRDVPLVATCSFYDRLLRIWVPGMEIAA